MLQVWDSPSLIQPILACGSFLYGFKFESTFEVFDDSACVTSTQEGKYEEDLANSWVMCMCNLIAGNSHARRLLWESLQYQSIK